MQRKNFEVYCDVCGEVLYCEGVYREVPRGYPNGVRVAIKCPHEWKCHRENCEECAAVQEIPRVLQV